MNLTQFGGDNRDHGKGFVIASLNSILDRLHVDAMITDYPWPNAQYDELQIAYRRFLRLTDEHTITNFDVRYEGGKLIARNGKSEDYFQPYFAEDYDLFLDPTDGIHPKGGSKNLTPAIIGRLLPANSKRIVMVYVTPTRDTREGHMFEDHFKTWFEKRLSAFGCWLSGNGVLFLAQPKNERLTQFISHISSAFGPFAATRIKELS